MPDLYRYFGLVFYFWSDEHNPIHLHVEYQGMGCIINLWKDGSITVKDMPGMKRMPDNMKNTALRLVRRKQNDVRLKWANYHLYDKKFKTEFITRRIV